MSKPPLALCVPCTIHKVHDGDTATNATITLDIQVRYLDCWAPELTEKGGPEARDAAKAAEGKVGRLLIPLDGANNIADLLTFGRVLGKFYPDGQEESESERLVRLGYATSKKPKIVPVKPLETKVVVAPVEVKPVAIQGLMGEIPLPQEKAPALNETEIVEKVFEDWMIDNPSGDMEGKE